MKEKRLKVYLDTSVISANFDDRNPDRKIKTRLFFANTRSFDVYYSYLTFTEIQQTPDKQLKKLMIEILLPFKKLTSNSRIKDLTDEYIQKGAITENYPEDATHIAIAVLNAMDYLLSWNFKHLVKEKTRKIVNQINSKLNYKRIVIITPAELSF
jgi:predicted nucleic acid-binding protein